MFSVKSKENFFSIEWKGHDILQGIRPVVTLGEGQVLEMIMKKEEAPDGAPEHRYEYEDAKEAVSLMVTLKEVQGLLLCYVDVRCKNENLWDKVQTLTPIGSVKLKIEGIGQIQGLMASYLYSDFWNRPYFKKNIGELPSRTQSLLWNDGNTYYHLLPVCGNVCKTELSGNGQGMDMTFSILDSGYTHFKTFAFVLGADQDPFKLSERTVTVGLQEHESAGPSRERRRYPEILEYLGWCSWDAFYHDVNAKGVLEKAQELHRQNLPVKWFMIDDGWSETKDARLVSFQENREKFPEGLKAVVEALKAEYGVKWVGVWHAFTGYWSGIHPESRLAQDMKEYVYTTHSGRILPYPEAGKGFMFWNAWHSYLRKQGIDFVKVDNQSALYKFVTNHMSIGEAAKGAHEALEASIGVNFDGCVINCMGMASEQLWHRPVSGVSRNSDDFFPKKEKSFKEHVLQNAYNSYYHSQFIWGDWDMWWTQHENNVQNAVLRAISGGPVYFSDGLGKTSPELLWPLILSDGRVLRCDQNGLPTQDCLLRNPNEEDFPIKIWNRYGDAGVVAAFNVNMDGKPVSGVLKPGDVPGMKGSDFAVYEYFSGQMIRMGRNESLEFTLGDDQVVLYVIVPVTDEFTPVGLVDKYIAPAGIQTWARDGQRVHVVLRDGGRFGFAGSEPSNVRVDGQETAFAFEKGLYIVDCSEHKGEVHMDIEF